MSRIEYPLNERTIKEIDAIIEKLQKAKRGEDVRLQSLEGEFTRENPFSPILTKLTILYTYKGEY